MRRLNNLRAGWEIHSRDYPRPSIIGLQDIQRGYARIPVLESFEKDDEWEQAI